MNWFFSSLVVVCFSFVLQQFPAELWRKNFQLERRKTGMKRKILTTPTCHRAHRHFCHFPMIQWLSARWSITATYATRINLLGRSDSQIAADALEVSDGRNFYVSGNSTKICVCSFLTFIEMLRAILTMFDYYYSNFPRSIRVKWKRHFNTQHRRVTCEHDKTWMSSTQLLFCVYYSLPQRWCDDRKERGAHRK